MRSEETIEPLPVIWELPLVDEATTHELAKALAEELMPGDLVALTGGLGAGKSVLARAMIRTLAGDQKLEVPSPTFTLVQSYDTPRATVLHADLYRLADAAETTEIGLDDIAAGTILIVEWPERAGSSLAAEARIEIALDLVVDAEGEHRTARIGATPEAAIRVLRARALAALLKRAGWSDAKRVRLQGDASTRAYERLERANGESAILMISPQRADGPPVRRGKPYSAIARLAESVHAFVAMDRGLRALGFSAPRIYGEDLEAGLLILEDLGPGLVVDESGPMPERYGEAVKLLARLHASPLPGVLPVGEGRDHILPPYDHEALLIEVELLVDWYVPLVDAPSLSPPVRAEFSALWGEVLQEVTGAATTWTLRDYHSPNLIWLPEREDVKQIGLLDFQDAVLGHPAYDVASLLQDARVTVPAELELKLLGTYARERAALTPSFAMPAFARAYAILGAQRSTKILGIFARLDRRDGKPQYLAHLPRMEAILRRNLAHPVLSRLKVWYQTHLPSLMEDGRP